MKMGGFEWKAYRDHLAKSLKEVPKDERNELLEIAQSYPEYAVAQELKRADQETLGNAQPEVRSGLFPESETITPLTPVESIRKDTEPPLPPSQDRRAREIARHDPEKLAHYLEDNGFSATRKTELLQHYTQELEESIQVISWTKERLAYTTAILEYTLETSDKSITSAENMIQNYLIFCRTFKESEGWMPRYGQFAYVMRSIFGGIQSKEEIYERIAQHKTFGEQVRVKEEDTGLLRDDVRAKAEVIHKQYRDAQEKKRHLDELLQEAEETEEKEKGCTWSVAYSKPKDYVFPNYRFQTGPLKGENHATGRSSWEPMLLAYADVVNKRMEDRIRAKKELTEEEKEKHIRERRIELLYEKFEFPVDVKMDEHGSEKPVIYILDFIDINRWRAIEVKGPLTPKAAEKIRLFKKYYVDGDFSDLPEDKKTVMMSYVQDTKDKIADWCHTHGYPVYDHFISIEVLGAFKWDHDLNNFNRYREARGMKGISKREQDLMQMGFFKQVEGRIASGKTPDIRPADYFKADKVQDLVQVNEAIAKARKIPYEVEKPITTKPFRSTITANHVASEYRQRGTNNPDDANDIIYRKVLETVPIPPDESQLLLDLIDSMSVIEKVDNEIRHIFETQSQSTIRKVEQGLTAFEFSVPSVNHEKYKKMISTLVKLVTKLRSNEVYADFELHFHIPKQEIIQYLERVTAYYRSMTPDINGRLQIRKRSIDLDHQSQPVYGPNGDGFDIGTIIRLFRNMIEGSYANIIHKRTHEVAQLVWSDEQIVNDKLAHASRYIQHVQDNPMLMNDPLWAYSYYVQLSIKFALENDIPEEMGPYLLYTEAVPYKMKIINLGTMLLLVHTHFGNPQSAAKQLALMKDRGFTEAQYLNFLERYSERMKDVYGNRGKSPGRITEHVDADDESIAASIGRCLLRNELGETRYTDIVRKLKDETVVTSATHHTHIHEPRTIHQ